jgi:DinB superfamily
LASPSRQDIHDEMDQARETFQRLLSHASPADLRRSTQGTRWNNEQLLFHLLFGYLIVRALRWLVKGFGRLPDRLSAAFARALNSVSAPFHAINYWGSRGGVIMFGHARMGRKMDRVIASMQRHLEHETDDTLALRMHFPTRWDPFFTELMTLADVYHYATQHFTYHRQQLTLHDAE